jgi:restriction system protein
MDTVRKGSIVQAPLLPPYSRLANAIRIIDGEPVRRVRDLVKALWDQTGTPQSPVDWSDPDKWINERLKGDLRSLAAKIWSKSNKTLNPRYIYGSYLLMNKQRLLEEQHGIYHINQRGKLFLSNDETLIRRIDEDEGIPKLLSLIAVHSSCKRADILPSWADYLKAVSLFTTQSTFINTLRHRLDNLTERALLTREGNQYAITSAGLSWLKGFDGPAQSKSASTSKRAAVIEAARGHNDEQLRAFKTRLMQLSAEQFEHFVKELLDAMEYEDVRVTKLSGDKGVDVIAKHQFGITEITEVVQVKRTEATITRPKIDELRGALPYHKAIRGTIMSLGRFAKGAQEGALYAGAAPITLIDGKRVLDLCVKHSVGIIKAPVDLYEINEKFFADKFGFEQNNGDNEELSTGVSSTDAVEEAS